METGSIDKAVLLDVGAREGVGDEWHVFDDRLHVIGFEPDPHEAELLQSDARDGWTFVASALGAKRETRRFNRTRLPAGSGIYASVELFDRTASRTNVEIVSRGDIDLVPLDDLDVGEVDFAKLDVELAELDVLIGGRRTFRNALAIEVEVHFPKRPSDAGCFAEVDAFIRELGLDLFDLDVYRFARGTFPSNPIYDFRDADGAPTPGPTVEGPVLTGDALYVRDLVRTDSPAARQVALLAAFYDIHRLPDCAGELLRMHGAALGIEIEDLLASLEPPSAGVSASDGRLYGPNYHLLEEAWRERVVG
jgi:FkbM family methyltransferase